MIKAIYGEVKLEGRRVDLQAEFLAIVETMKREKLFLSDDDMMDSIKFAMMDKNEQKRVIVEKMLATLESGFDDENV